MRESALPSSPRGTVRTSVAPPPAPGAPWQPAPPAAPPPLLPGVDPDAFDPTPAYNVCPGVTDKVVRTRAPRPPSCQPFPPLPPTATTSTRVTPSGTTYSCCPVVEKVTVV